MSIVKAQEEFDKAFLSWQLDILIKREQDMLKFNEIHWGFTLNTVDQPSYHLGRIEAFEYFKSFIEDFCDVQEGR